MAEGVRAALTVGPSQTASVKAYVLNQEKHHRSRTFERNFQSSCKRRESFVMKIVISTEQNAVPSGTRVFDYSRPSTNVVRELNGAARKRLIGGERYIRDGRLRENSNLRVIRVVGIVVTCSQAGAWPLHRPPSPPVLLPYPASIPHQRRPRRNRSSCSLNL